MVENVYLFIAYAKVFTNLLIKICYTAGRKLSSGSIFYIKESNCFTKNILLIFKPISEKKLNKSSDIFGWWMKKVPFFDQNQMPKWRNW
jgi:hypothetical protein